ncbi:MAG: peptide chain release factor 1 [Bacteroidota bacterium]|jgi:peptide chain release factor 1
MWLFLYLCISNKTNKLPKLNMSQESLLDKLDVLVIRFEEIGKLITDPNVISDMKRYVKLNKEYRDLEKIAIARKEYAQVLNNLSEAKSILENESDSELREIAKDELEESNKRLPELEEEIKILLVPADPQDNKNAIVEIRGGTGGDEAALFAGDLYRMYVKYCESKNWKTEVTSCAEGTSGGFKEIIFTVTGDGVYGVLKYESGVHRVQRVPSTETQGRVHTSAATVAVLPEAEEFDIELKDSDIRVDTFCASGNGGQSVNTTYSAIRLVHIPTGVTVQCQDEKSQLKNKAKAMVELRSRIYNMEYQKYMDDIASKRKTMVSTGDRSAKIRTYNFPQGRITDHRINLTIYNLSAVMDGNIQQIIDPLIIAENAERLKESEL